MKEININRKKLFGYASGQEFSQYFISYEYMGIIGSVLVTLFFAWYGYEFMDIGLVVFIGIIRRHVTSG